MSEAMERAVEAAFAAWQANFKALPLSHGITYTATIGSRQDDAIRAAIRAAFPILAEELVGIATGYATCGCGGKYGRCNTDDLPLAIAAALRTRISEIAGGAHAG